jgi:hypothetical protein
LGLKEEPGQMWRENRGWQGDVSSGPGSRERSCHGGESDKDRIPHGRDAVGNAR